MRNSASGRRLRGVTLAALSLAAALSASACTPLSLIHATAKTGASTPVKSVAPAGTTTTPTYPVKTYLPSSYATPYATRLAAPHFVASPNLQAYPWASDETWSSDAYGQTRRQCVSYAAWYLNSHGTPFGYFTKGPKGTAVFGNATNWDSAARTVGFTVSTTPVVGSIAQWHANESTSWGQNGYWYTFTAGSVGHVAVVIKTYTDGTVDVAQYNLGDSRNFSTAHLRAPRYIYVPLASPKVP